MAVSMPALEAYAAAHSRTPSAALRRIEKETLARARHPQMMVGSLEGGLLAALVKLSGAKTVLEIGTFTGYSALAMAEALPASGKVMTLDLDPYCSSIAKKGWKRSPHGRKIRQMLGHALNTLPALKGKFDFCFIDADKLNYPHYYEHALRLVRRGGLIAADNTLWGGEVLKPKSKEAKILHRFNRSLRSDKRVETLLLPIRDGLTLARVR